MKILPDVRELTPLEDNVTVEQWFEWESGEGEALVRFEFIFDVNLKGDIRVGGSHYAVTPINIMGGDNLIRYRDGDDMKTAKSFDDMPPKGTDGIQVYEYNSRQPTRPQGYAVRVTAIYTIDGEEEEHSVHKMYTHPVKESYSGGGKELKEYVL